MELQSKILNILYNIFILGRLRDSKGEFLKENISKILVVRNDNVGDVICSTPAIQALRENFPKAYIAVLVASYSKEAILGNPYIDEVFIYDKYKHGKYKSRWVAWWNQFKILRALRRKRFDLAIGLRSTFSPSQGWLVYFTGASFRLGTYPSKKKHKKFKFFYNLFTDEVKNKIHEVEKNCRMLETIGIKVREKRLTVYIPEEDVSRVDKFLVENRITDKLLIGFYISSRLKENNLGDNKIVEVADKLIERYKAEILLTRAPLERERAQKISELIQNRIYIFETPTLKSLGALQKRCSLFISVDGGSMHLSAAVGVTTIALFGKTNPDGWRPWGEKNLVLKKGENVNNISVEEILKTADQALKINI